MGGLSTCMKGGCGCVGREGDDWQGVVACV